MNLQAKIYLLQTLIINLSCSFEIKLKNELGYYIIVMLKIQTAFVVDHGSDVVR